MWMEQVHTISRQISLDSIILTAYVWLLKMWYIELSRQLKSLDHPISLDILV